MTVKAVPQKSETPPKQSEPSPADVSGKAADPKKAAVATVLKAEAHHATLTETKCSDCTVGLLKQYINPSLRNQRKLDPGNQKYHLQDNEEIEFLRAKPLTLQLIGLRRERSLSNKFDDLLVVMYDPALLKEEETTVLEDPALRKENLESTQSFVDKVLASKERPAPKDWPLPGTDVSCLQCKHWRVVIFPITTEPGYDPQAPKNKKDARGRKLPNFDDLTLLPEEVGSVAPGIYNNHYRVGLHLGVRKPPNSFAALQLVPDSIPARRRYPIGLFLRDAETAFKQGGKTDDNIQADLIRRDSKTPKDVLASIMEELKAMPRGTKTEKAAFDKEVKNRLATRNREFYAPKVLEVRKNAARSVLSAMKARINSNERYIRLENSGGEETQNFEKQGNKVSNLEVADDDTSAIRVCVRLVFEAPPSDSTAAGTTPPSGETSPHAPPDASPKSGAPAAKAVSAAPIGQTAAPTGTSPEAPTPPRALVLTPNDILVTFGTAAGTNIHRSAREEAGSWSSTREVNNWSEGCQVFRSPNDFRNFMRMAMLSKRAHCPSRATSCGTTLTVQDVDKGIGANLTAYLKNCPKEFANDANDALKNFFPSSAPSPQTAEPADSKTAGNPHLKAQQRKEALMKLFTGSDAHKDFTAQVEKIYRTTFPTKEYYTEATCQGLEEHARNEVLGALDEKSSEDDIKKAVDASIGELTRKLTEFKDTWLKDLHAQQLNDKHAEYLADGLEPCDFGTCGFKFDYMLAEVARTHLEEFVSKLGDRDWNTLFPQDAPPPEPKPPRSARPTARPSAK